jgi:hypothetical protein
MDRWLLLEGARRAYEVMVLAVDKRHVSAIPRLTVQEIENAPAPE